MFELDAAQRLVAAPQTPASSGKKSFAALLAERTEHATIRRVRAEQDEARGAVAPLVDALLELVREKATDAADAEKTSTDLKYAFSHTDVGKASKKWTGFLTTSQAGGGMPFPGGHRYRVPSAAEKRCNELFEKVARYSEELSNFDRMLHQNLLAFGGKLTFGIEARNASERAYTIGLDWSYAALGASPPERLSLTPSSPPRSNISATCPVCWEAKKCVPLSPCGHLVCTSCPSFVGKSCPVCQDLVLGEHNLFDSAAQVSHPAVEPIA